jgi:hypothetical protein
MFKFIVVVLLFVIGAALYDQNQISSMNDEQKQAVLKEREIEKQHRLESKQKQALAGEKQSLFILRPDSQSLTS